MYFFGAASTTSPVPAVDDISKISAISLQVTAENNVDRSIALQVRGNICIFSFWREVSL